MMDELVFRLTWNPIMVGDMGIDVMAHWLGRYQARESRR